ncbi:MAG TPA: O-antigen polymerase, partial [Gemmatirosa sp.]
LTLAAALAVVLGLAVGDAGPQEYGIELLLAAGIVVVVLFPIVVRGWRGRLDPFEPLLTVAGVYLVYFVLGPLLRLLTGTTIVIGRDMRAFYAPAFAAVLVGVVAMWLGYHLPLGETIGRQLTRVRGSEQSSPAALRRIRHIGWGLTVAAIAALVLWTRLEGRSLSHFLLPGVIAPAEKADKSGGGTNLAYLFLAIEWFIPAFLMLSVSGGFRSKPIQWAYFAFVSIAYTSLGYRYRLIILWVATFMLAYLRRGRRPRGSTLLAGAAAVVLFAGWLGIARAVFKSETRKATATPTFIQVVRNTLSDTEVFETFGAVLDAVPGRVEFAGADPYVYVFIQPIPRVIWPEKPLPTFLDKIARAINTRASGNAGAAVPHFGEYYLAFGWPGLLLGMAAFGVLVRALWAWYLTDPRNAWRQVVFAVSNAFLVQVIIRGYAPQIVQEWFFIIGPAALGMWLAHRGERPTLVRAPVAAALPLLPRAELPALPPYRPAMALTEDRLPS